MRDYTRKFTHIIVRNPTPEDMRNLRQSASTHMLAVESVDVDGDNRLVVCHETRFAGERIQFVVKRDYPLPEE